MRRYPPSIRSSLNSALLTVGLVALAGSFSLAQNSSVDPPVKLYFYHLDHLGTPRVITDVDGNVVSQHKYLPFGEELSAPPSTNTHEFTGHERDSETGLDYMLARMYGQASTLRFLSVDPFFSPRKNLNNPQRWNRYTYSLNNPIKFVDPDGRDAVTSVDQQNRTVTITVNVILQGGTQEQASKFQNDANAKLSGQKEFTAGDGAKWTMNIQVNASNDSSKFSQTDQPNTLAVNNTGTTEMLPGGNGMTSNEGTLNSSDLSNPTTAAHEAGHMIGLTDQYTCAGGGTPLPGKEGSLMGDPKNPDAKPSQEEIDETGNNAIESAKPEKK